MHTPPSVWGPKYWYVIHTYADSYPEVPSDVDREIAKTFIKILPFLLPCGTCSKHAYEYIKLYYKHIDLIVSSRTELKKFFFIFHDNVNTRLGKARYSLPTYQKNSNNFP